MLEKLAALETPAAEPKEKPCPEPFFLCPFRYRPRDYSKLEPGTQLTHKYVVEKWLGRWVPTAMVYKVINTFWRCFLAL